MNENYTTITLQMLLDTVRDNPQTYSDGMNTVILSGDFEGNYTHRRHEIMHDGKALCLGYEMHEGGNY